LIRKGLVLVEGQSEERFVKDVLGPPMLEQDLVLIPTLIVTKVVKSGPNFKGGVSGYQKIRRDLTKLLGDSSAAVVTTMLDYYALPDDFPGMATRPSGTALIRAQYVETAIMSDLGSPRNFLPYLSLHEFEATLFSCPDELPRTMTDTTRRDAFAGVRDAFPTPEDINDRPGHAPSHRIRELFPAYQKVLHGTLTAGRIGLGKIRRECPHFNAWIERLETVAQWA
jgi:hypothetical protein